VASRIATAAEIVLAEPGAWLVSAAGFLARGGVVLFLAALLQLPSPITLTLIFGVDSVTATGEPAPRLIVTLATLVGIAALAGVAMLLVAAWSDVVSIGRVRNVAPVRAGGAPPWASLDGSGPRRRLSALADVLGVAWLQSLGLLPGVIGVALVAPTLHDVAVGEVLLPSSLSIPFLVRVFSDVATPLGRALVVLAVGELLVTIATRRYLGTAGNRSTLRAYGGAVSDIVRRPGVIAVAWLVGLVVLFVAAVAALWAVTMAWNEVRAFFLDIDFATPPALPGCGDAASCGPFPRVIGGIPFEAAVGAIVAALLFAVVWVAAIGVIGIASAFRSALWTLTIGGRNDVPVGVAWPVDVHP
jgi:hypothetical protein